MNLSLIETILAVSKHESFLEASYDLNYTPAVISKHIARAEEELGVKLFIRGNKSNSVAMTPECLMIIKELEEMADHYSRVLNILDAIKDPEHDSVVKIGLTLKSWNFGESAIIADFVLHNPDISLEQVKGYSEDLLHKLELAEIDCAFITCQGKLDEYEHLQRYAYSNEFDFFLFEEINTMYMAVSSDGELGHVKEADFNAFRDYKIAFNSDRRAMTAVKNEIPFRILAEKYGFELKPIRLFTSDASSYLVAQHARVAIPVPNPDAYFDGINYVRLTDWNTPLYSYFVTRGPKFSKAAAKLKKAVSVYSLKKMRENKANVQ